MSRPSARPYGPARARCVAALAALALCAARRDAAACTVCACGDPTLSVQGSDAPEQPELRAGLELRAHERHLEAGTPTQLRGSELRATAGLAYTPSRYVSLVALAPWVLHRVEASNLATRTVSSLGDLELQARVHVYRDRRWLARHALSALAGVTLPTAPRATGRGGAVIAADEQPGTGGLGVALGLAYVYRHPAGRLAVYASALAQWNSPGWDGYARGLSLRASALPAVQVHRAVSLAPGLDLRFTTPDREGGPVEHTGGWFLYASPTALFLLTDETSLRVTAQIPLVQAGLGAQRESPALLVGLSRVVF